MKKPHGHHKGKKEPTFIKFRHDMFDSPAYWEMDFKARAALYEFIRRHNGFNNGYISFSVREMMSRLNCSKDTAGKAIISLIEHGFIAVTEDSAFNVKDRKARRFALTDIDVINKNNGHKIPSTNKWRKWKPAVDDKNKIQS